MRDFLKWLTLAIVIASALEVALEQIAAADPESTPPRARTNA